MNIVNTNPVFEGRGPIRSALSLDEMLQKIREKRIWLRSEDKLKLCDRYACSLATLDRHLNGTVRKINIKLVADALDIANANETLISSKL